MANSFSSERAYQRLRLEMNQHVTLLGPPQIVYELGEAPAFRSMRARALLGYLAVEMRPVSREFLATFIWPDVSYAAGRAKLRRELYNLAQILPGCWQTDRQMIAFAPTAETTVDIYLLQEFEAGEKWPAAAELLGGLFLEGVVLPDNIDFDNWLAGERSRWQEHGELLLNRLVDNCISESQFDQALAYAHQLLQMAPWNEEMHRQVMLVLARTGQRAAALRQYEHSKAVLWEELAMEPAAETTALYERILAGEITQETGLLAVNWQPVVGLPSHLPQSATEFVGRKEEIETIAFLFGERRLINLVGPGGIGKTRLGIATAEKLRDEFAQGVHFVSLLTHESPTAVVPAIADVLDLELKEGRSPKDQLLDFLQPFHMLLLLDNLEHLLGRPGSAWAEDGVEILIEELLRAVPNLKILGTSREVLKLPQETVFTVEGLPIHAADQEAGSAVSLFLRRMALKQPELVIDQPMNSMIHDFCRQVEGMPLAIELAAAQTRLVSIPELTSAIAGNLDAFDAGTRGISARHRSIRIVFETTWKSLSDREQQVFARLAVFQGGISLPGAVQVAGAAMSDLGVLLDKSLIRLDPDGRYKRHPLIRTFSAEKLAEMPGERPAARERHYRYMVRVLQGAIATWWESRDLADLQILKLEGDNLRLAWQ